MKTVVALLATLLAMQAWAEPDAAQIRFRLTEVTTKAGLAHSALAKLSPGSAFSKLPGVSHVDVIVSANYEAKNNQVELLNTNVAAVMIQPNITVAGVELLADVFIVDKTVRGRELHTENKIVLTRTVPQISVLIGGFGGPTESKGYVLEAETVFE